MKQQGLSHIIVIVAIVMVGVIGFAGWRVYDARQNSEPTTAITQPTPVDNTVQSSQDVAELEAEVDSTNLDTDLDSSELDASLNDIQ